METIESQQHERMDAALGADRGTSVARGGTALRALDPGLALLPSVLLVGARGFEPLTSSASRKAATTSLPAALLVRGVAWSTGLAAFGSGSLTKC
jgi:hypothetical protein